MSGEGLLVVSRGEDPITADVVFVHGLGGSREGSWTRTKVVQDDGSKKDIFWPGALLAKEPWMKHVRVMSWGYDSKIAKFIDITSQNSIFGHTDNLLDDIAGVRFEQDEQDRPIIFIGHSLGGLVIKQVLIRSNQIFCNNQDPHLGAIYTSTRGVIFLGTPHRGSKLASMGDTVRHIVLDVWKQPNKKLLKSLKDDSEVLEQQISAFSSVSKDIRLVCIWEEIQTRLLGLVVEQSSAVMDGHNVKSLSIHDNHMDMCKFKDMNDSGYIKTSRQIRMLLSKAVSARVARASLSEPSSRFRKDQSIKILQILRGSRNYELNKDRNKRRVPGTCRWILEGRKFTDWCDGISVGLLWISAGPGFGKSVFARSLIDENLLGKPKTTICYFFFREDDEDSRQATDALSALLHQLLVKHPVFMKYVLPYAKDGNLLSRLIHALWDILLEIVNDPASPIIIFIIDSLDESEDNGKALIEKLVNFYTQHQTQTGSQNVTTSKLKFLVTSRGYDGIQMEFGNLARGENGIQLSLDKTGIPMEDIKLVAEAELSLIKDRRRVQEEVIDFLRDILLTTENRNYLWLHLTLDLIKNSVGVTTEPGLLKLMAQPPKTLKEAYEAILRKNPNPEDAEKLLRMVVAAVRPLTIPEMRIAIAIGEDTQSRRSLKLESIENFEATIRNQCGLFITITNNTIYLIHNTAKEFLLSRPGSPSVVTDANGYRRWENSIDPLEAHGSLSWACVRYLCFSEFEKSQSTSLKPNTQIQVPNVESDEESTSGKPQDNDLDDNAVSQTIDSMTVYDPRYWEDITLKKRFRKHHFVEYASLHWLSHFKMAGSCDSMLQQSLGLCNVDSNLCANWFETLRVNESRDLGFFKSSFKDALVKGGENLAFCCFVGHTRGMESLLQEMKLGYTRPESQEAVQDALLAALYLAVEEGMGEIVRILLAERPKMVNMALSHEASSILQNLWSLHELTALRLAVQSGQHDLVPLLLEMNADPNAIGSTTILADAINSTGSAKELSQTIKLLLQYGANVNDIGTLGNSPLNIALDLELPDYICHLLRDAGGKILNKDHMYEQVAYVGAW